MRCYVNKFIMAAFFTMFGALSAVAATVTTQVAGEGSVTLNPSVSAYPTGTEVELTAVPAPGYKFDHWEIIQQSTTANTPFPENNAVNTGVQEDLNWTAGTDSPPTSHDIYFGTTNPPPFVRN